MELKYQYWELKSRKLVKKRCQRYLAYLMNKPKGENTLESTMVVKEYLNVFPEELLTLPLPRDVEFAIDLVYAAGSISRILYCIALLDLKELKEQLEELLSQGYI
jgi:hypothetical protein